MTMMTTRDALAAWANWERPLRTLTKTQLWKYPLADPSADAEWKFSKEVMCRQAVYRQREIEADEADGAAARAARFLASAEANLAVGKDKADEAKLHGQQDAHVEKIKRLENAVRLSKTGLQQATETAAKLRAALDQVGDVDEMVSADEIYGYYAKRYAGQWNRIITAWQEKQLFKAQFYGFTSFLSARGPEQREDAQAFKDAEGIAVLVGQTKSATFLSMRDLYHARVMPALQARREFLTDGQADGQIQVAALKPEQRQKYWAWWRAYNKATFTNKWPDDSGVAYDARLFDPDNIRPEERNDD